MSSFHPVRRYRPALPNHLALIDIHHGSSSDLAFLILTIFLLIS
jgi:hypothetical protein